MNDDSHLTPTEHTVAAMWSEEIKLASTPGPDDSFFKLGGDSFAMTLVLFRVEETFCLKMPPEALLENPRLRDFCRRIDLQTRSCRAE